MIIPPNECLSMGRLGWRDDRDGLSSYRAGSARGRLTTARSVGEAIFAGRTVPIRLSIALWLLAAQVSVGHGQELTTTERGRALVARMCARCHAIGAVGASPHPVAPPLR